MGERMDDKKLVILTKILPALTNSTHVTIKTDVPAVIVQCQSSNYACLTVVGIIMILSRHYLMVLFLSSEDRL